MIFHNLSGNLKNTDSWSTEYLIDNIFNNLMENGYEKDEKINKYIIQLIDKFNFFRIKSPITIFEINIKDLYLETKYQINNYTEECKTKEKKYRKLDGIVTEVIARITKQATPMILSQRINEDIILFKSSLKEIRELVSFKWILR